jgi:hypothetical protein
MLNGAAVTALFQSPLLTERRDYADHPTAPAALPDNAITFLLDLAREIGATTIFEFGSGMSTAAFLRAGYRVTSLEDSDQWMGQTVAQLADEQRRRHTALVRPLRLKLHGLIPVMDWAIDSELAALIGSADLILVDSPYFAPFRESTLWSALTHNATAVVVLDDTRIPTLNRLCGTLADLNPSLLHCRVHVGHCFDLFSRGGDAQSLKLTHGTVETFKGWRRFVAALRS